MKDFPTLPDPIHIGFAKVASAALDREINLQIEIARLGQEIARFRGEIEALQRDLEARNTATVDGS
jgi:hypothetical protein